LADRFNTLRFDLEQQAVVLLDRRAYPFRTTYVACRTVEETAQAIEQMVVQGGPPLAYAAGLGLALVGPDLDDLRQASQRLLATRPTADDLHAIVPQALQRAEAALAAGESPQAAILDYVNSEIERGNQVSQACGAHAATLLRDGDRILTHCLAGAALCWMLWIARQQGKQVTLIPTETRPYLQGARLTAQCAVEMGIPVKLITDGMPAHLMSQGLIDKFICAADRITLDGHITNKVGTLHNAIADEPAGPKTFATKAKLIARIEQVAAAGSIDLASFGQGTDPEVTEQRAQPQADVTETVTVVRTFDLVPVETEKKPSGKGIGRLARELLMDPAGYPHGVIAEMVNAQIEGAQASAKSVRWYAHDMRKKGAAVPERQRVAESDPV
jgi:methylthioribose-1-phosphate isomerase